MRTLSLNQRIIFGAIIVLLFFITLTAAALNKAFIKSSENALKSTLTTQLYALLANAEVDLIDNKTQFSMPSDNLATLLGLPNSGLYAQVIDAKSNIVWQSESNINALTPSSDFIASGKKTILKKPFKEQQFYQIAFGIEWLINDKSIPLTFVINQDLKTFNQLLNDYSNTLWLWLGGMAVFLIVSQILILKWGLTPINDVVKELQKIEQGKQQKIEQQYPKEIEFLSSNINHLLDNEQAQKARYRNALGDLAHSLKTPLAIIQSSLTSDNKNEIMSEQITRMNNIVEYQLQKAATAGANNLSQAINISQLLQRIIDSLQKVYSDKNLNITFKPQDAINYKADEGDMMELFGNIIDNAFKWASKTIEITCTVEHEALCVVVQDDGVGFPVELIEQLKIRGQRADESTPGHGIGLSIVNNIIDSYNGQMSIANVDPSGSRIEIKI